MVSKMTGACFLGLTGVLVAMYLVMMRTSESAEPEATQSDEWAAPVDSLQPGGPAANDIWEVRGRCVRLEGGTKVPVPNALVTVFAETSGSPPTVRSCRQHITQGARVRLAKPASVRSDENGAFAVDVSRFKGIPARDRIGNCWCEARAPGYRTCFEYAVRPPVDRTASYQGRVELELHPCVKVLGRVVDGKGRPVSGASILAEKSTEGDRGRRDADIQEELLEGSTFELTYFKPGVAKVRAWEPAFGASEQEEVELRLGPEAIRLPDLELRELGVIEGRARFPNGDPAPYLDLHLHWESIPEGEAGDGRRGTKCVYIRTDRTGRFAARCLDSGKYEVTVHARPEGTVVTRDVTLASTGSRNVEVVVRRPILSIVLEDFKEEFVGSRIIGWCNSWSGQNAVAACAADAAGGDAGACRHLNGAVVLFGWDGNRVNHFVQPDSYHHVALSWRGFDVVRFGRGDWRKEIRTNAKELGKSASVAVRLCDRSGRELLEREVELEPIDAVRSHSRWKVAGPAYVENPLVVEPGRYRMRVAFPFPRLRGDEVARALARTDVWAAARCAFLPVEREVVVASGANVFEVTGRRSGFVQALFETHVSDRADGQKFFVTLRSGGDGDRRVELHLREEGFGLESYLTDWVPLAAGKYELLFQHPKRGLASKRIAVEVGSVWLAFFGAGLSEG